MSRTLRVLLVEAAQDDARMVTESMARGGLDTAVTRVETAADMRAALSHGEFDIVLSEYALPEFGAPAALALLRASGIDLPFVVVSGTTGEEVAVEMLTLGADDYLVKPRLARLVPAIERSVTAAAGRRQRLEAWRALRQNEEHLRRVFDLASIGLGVLDAVDGRWIRVNQALAQIAGSSPEELLNSQALALSSPERKAADWELFGRAVRGELDGGTIEGPLVRRDGSRTWVKVNLSREMREDGQVEHLLVVVEDVSARKLVEEEQRRLFIAVEQAAEAVVITDLEPKILYVNPAFERISGYSRSEALGQNPRILKSGQHDGAHYEAMWRALAAGKSWTGLLINKRRDGSLYYEEATISPVHDDAGTIVNYVAVKRDVTYERQVEEQFRQSQKLEAIGQLAGGVAHDFNNLLSVIKGHAELVELTADLPNPVRAAIGEIGLAADRAAALTRQLLLFSRRQALQLSTVDLNDVVANMSRMLVRILGEDIEVLFQYGPRPLTVNADTGMMDQVLLNLAVNARDAMPHGGQLCVSVSACDIGEGDAPAASGATPGKYACLSVSDDGGGIAPDVLPRMFEPFYTTKEVGKGTGLGLATVLGIIQQHGGWIDVDSEIGRGSTFRVYLPRTGGEAPQASGPASLSTLPRGEETVLLVEDDVALRRLVKSILSMLGYRVHEAASGREGLAVWAEHQQEIRLLLTDLVMPDGMSGLELARLLLGHNPALKVIYASGYSADAASLEVPLREGVNFLSKPYSPQKLAETVRRCLSA